MSCALSTRVARLEIKKSQGFQILTLFPTKTRQFLHASGPAFSLKRHKETIPHRAAHSKGRGRLSQVRALAWGQAMLTSPNEVETAAQGCHCPVIMFVRIRKVLILPRRWYVCFSADIGIVYIVIQPTQGSTPTSYVRSGSNRKLEVLVLRRGENQNAGEKPLGARKGNNNKPTNGVDTEI